MRWAWCGVVVLLAVHSRAICPPGAMCDIDFNMEDDPDMYEWALEEGESEKMKYNTSVVKVVLDPYLGDYGEDDPRHERLMTKTEPGGEIHSLATSEARSPFDNLPLDEYPFMTRYLWWATRYAYDADAHFINEDKEKEDGHRIESITSWVFNKDDNPKTPSARADAEARIISPDMNLMVNEQNPSIWYCEKYHPGAFCQSPNTLYYHVVFRGMQLFKQFRVAPLWDLINMRERMDLVKCRFRFRTMGEVTMEISAGGCVMTKSLVRAGLLQSIINKITAGNQYFISFHGLSYGATLAQTFSLLLAKTIDLMDGLPVAKSDIRLHVMTFGAPRVGQRQFIYDYLNQNIYSDQFIMYSYCGKQGETSNMRYDPLTMWPPHFYPVGNVHSLLFYYMDENHKDKTLITEVRHDLFRSGSAPFSILYEDESRNVVIPEGNQESFHCLHAFHLYHSFFRRHYYTSWDPLPGMFEGCGPHAQSYIGRNLKATEVVEKRSTSVFNV